MSSGAFCATTLGEGNPRGRQGVHCDPHSLRARDREQVALGLVPVLWFVFLRVITIWKISASPHQQEEIAQP